MRSAARAFGAASLLLAVQAGPSLEQHAGAPPGTLAPAVARQLSNVALHITDSSGGWMTIWLAPSPPRATEAPDRIVVGIVPGALVGALELERAWRDYRDGVVPPGLYTLRYAVQPILKEHAGTSAYRDFLVLVPAAVDDGSAGAPERWIAASRGVAAPAHPAVLALVPASGEENRLEANGEVAILIVPKNGLALVLKGHGIIGGF